LLDLRSKKFKSKRIGGKALQNFLKILYESFNLPLELYRESKCNEKENLKLRGSIEKKKKKENNLKISNNL
jgi:hypothetical protein